MEKLNVAPEDPIVEPPLKRYYVNDTAYPKRRKNSKDRKVHMVHEVHKEGCGWLNDIESPTDLGMFKSCHNAVKKAGKRYMRVDGCKICSKPCNKYSNVVDSS